MIGREIGVVVGVVDDVQRHLPGTITLPIELSHRPTRSMTVPPFARNPPIKVPVLDQRSQTPASSGDFVVDNRTVLAIAVPMTLAYLTTPLIGLVDTAVVGHLGDAALLGGLAAGAIIFDIVFSTFNFLRSGTTGLVAQAFGRGDAAEEQAVLLRAVIVSLVIGIALALLAPLVSLAGAWFIGAEPRVLAAMDVYVRIRLLGAPFALATMRCSATCWGAARAGSAFSCNSCSTAPTSRWRSCSASIWAGAWPASRGARFSARRSAWRSARRCWPGASAQRRGHRCGASSIPPRCWR